MPVELDQKPCPDLFYYLWQIFRNIETGRQFSEAGLIPFSWSDLYAWCKLTRTTLSTSEIEIIRQLDFISIKRKEE